jgi:nicotinamide-nucleotide amidase
MTKLPCRCSAAPGASERSAESLPAVHDFLKAKGAVCREVAVAMAEGALHRSPADVAVAVTGVAAPDHTIDWSPMGRACFAPRAQCQR